MEVMLLSAHHLDPGETEKKEEKRNIAEIQKMIFSNPRVWTVMFAFLVSEDGGRCEVTCDDGGGAGADVTR